MLFLTINKIFHVKHQVLLESITLSKILGHFFLHKDSEVRVGKLGGWETRNDIFTAASTHPPELVLIFLFFLNYMNEVHSKKIKLKKIYIWTVPRSYKYCLSLILVLDIFWRPADTLLFCNCLNCGKVTYSELH